MSISTDLSVRQHERHTCDAPVRIAIAPSSKEAVRLGSAALSAGAGRVVDFSRGGLGLRTGVYYPLTCVLRLTVPVPDGPPVVLEARVQRSTMTDRKPSYYIGTAFENGAAQAEAISRVVAMLEASRGAPLPLPGKEAPGA